MMLFWRYEVCVSNPDYPNTFDIMKRFWSEKKALLYRKQLLKTDIFKGSKIIILSKYDDRKTRKWRIHL